MAGVGQPLFKPLFTTAMTVVVAVVIALAAIAAAALLKLSSLLATITTAPVIPCVLLHAVGFYIWRIGKFQLALCNGT